MSLPPIDTAAFRQVMAQFVTGVTVVTAHRPGSDDLHGMTCNSFSSVSSHAGLISVCLTRGSRTEQLVDALGAFAVNVLAATQEEVANRFAGRHKAYETERFDGIPWTPAPGTGAPLIEGAKAHLDCRVETTVRIDDHSLFIARVVGSEFAPDLAPLVFYKSRFVDLA